MEIKNAEPQLRIGQLAAELGLNPKTIRYYEAIGSYLNPGARLPATAAMTPVIASDCASSPGQSPSVSHLKRSRKSSRSDRPGMLRVDTSPTCSITNCWQSKRAFEC